MTVTQIISFACLNPLQEKIDKKLESKASYDAWMKQKEETFVKEKQKQKRDEEKKKKEKEREELQKKKEAKRVGKHLMSNI